MDKDRLEQFAKTKAVYDAMPQIKEFIIPTRTKDLLKILEERGLDKDVVIVYYELNKGFNCSKALNLGVQTAKYDTIIITSPEVKPLTDVLSQFEPGVNTLAQVFDEDVYGGRMSLVNKSFRGDSPAMYFLAQFNKKDIEEINGWDEEFLRGYAYEDNDFGDRWNRAGLPFEIREDIQALHQYHPRSETIHDGLNTNYETYELNNSKGVIKPMSGLRKL